MYRLIAVTEANLFQIRVMRDNEILSKLEVIPSICKQVRIARSLYARA